MGSDALTRRRISRPDFGKYIWMMICCERPDFGRDVGPRRSAERRISTSHVGREILARVGVAVEFGDRERGSDATEFGSRHYWLRDDAFPIHLA
jgi:hypothetical protein